MVVSRIWQKSFSVMRICVCVYTVTLKYKVVSCTERSEDCCFEAGLEYKFSFNSLIRRGRGGVFSAR